MWPENPTEGQTHDNDGRRYVYRNGEWVLDLPDFGGVFRSGDVVRFPDGSVYEVDMGPNGPEYRSIDSLPEGVAVNWDFSQEGTGEGDDDSLVNTILDLLGISIGGRDSGGMNQDQRQVLYNEIKDLLDVTIGDQTATVGDQTTDVEVGDQTTDIEIGETDINASSTVEVGDQTTTIEEGAFDVEGGAGGTSTATGGNVGNVETGASTATVGNVSTGASTPG